MSTYIYDFFGRLGIIENTLKKMFYYTIDQDIFYFILNLKFIFVTYVFVPYFVLWNVLLNVTDRNSFSK